MPGDWWYWAYEQALGEFGCCIRSTVRYKEIFPGLFCGGCDEYVHDCRCKRLCGCGVYVAKWGWSDVGAECECTPRKPRGAEWEEADPRFRMKGCCLGMAMSEIARALFGASGANLTAEFAFFVLGCFLNWPTTHAVWRSHPKKNTVSFRNWKT